MSKKLRVAIVGYGNVGKYTLEAVQAAPDMELAGVVRRSPAGAQPPELAGVKVVADIRELEGVQGALLCTPTRSVPELRWARANTGSD